MKTFKLVSILAIAIMCAVAANGQVELGKIDGTLQKQIGASLTSYYELKDAMVDSDADIAAMKAEDLVAAFSAIEVSKMTAAQKAYWAKLESPLKTDARHINENTDLEHQREHFMKLSNNMYALVFGFKANKTEAYLQYCPMKKASWLSESKEIRNPYYGSKMLTCGSVKATLKKN
ncbi:MAG: DUF3347 domain-containing protein [Pyrinomonadaceae bacterium]